MASISKTVRPKRSNNRTVAPTGLGAVVSRGTVTVTVPGTPSYPNKPSGYTNTREISFTQSIPSGIGSERAIASSGTPGWRMIYDQNDGGVSTFSQQTDGTAPNSPPAIWRLHFIPGTYTDGHASGNVFTVFSAPKPQRLYCSFVFMLNAGFPFHPISNKFIWMVPGQLLIQLQETIRWLHAEHLDGSQWLDNVIGPTNGATLHTYNNDAVSTGAWHNLEFVLDRPAGTWQIWLDGSLKLNASGITITDPEFDEFLITGHRGGGGETLATDGYWYYDHIHLAWPTP